MQHSAVFVLKIFFNVISILCTKCILKLKKMFWNHLFLHVFLFYLVGVTVSEVEVKERTEEGTSTKIAKGITVGKEDLWEEQKSTPPKKKKLK